MVTVPIDPSETLRRGVSACRAGSWREGHAQLTRLAQQEERYRKLPGLFYSYLGQAMARCEGRLREGLDLCLHAVDLEPFQPENFVNLAGIYLMLRNKRGALRALAKGLSLDPSHAGLLEIGRNLGVRRRPPFPFLARTNPFNRYLGLVGSLRSRRHAWRQPEDNEGDDF